jgi:hypothetical protein
LVYSKSVSNRSSYKEKNYKIIVGDELETMWK